MNVIEVFKKEMNKSHEEIHENTHKNYQWIEINETVEECCTQTQKNIISFQNLMELHKIDYILELKASTNRHKKIDIISLILAPDTSYNFILIITSTAKIKIKFLNLWNWKTLYLLKIAQSKKETLQFNENKPTTYLDLWGTMKEVLWRKIKVT